MFHQTVAATPARHALFIVPSSTCTQTLPKLNHEFRRLTSKDVPVCASPTRHILQLRVLSASVSSNSHWLLVVIAHYHLTSREGLLCRLEILELLRELLVPLQLTSRVDHERERVELRVDALLTPTDRFEHAQTLALWKQMVSLRALAGASSEFTLACDLRQLKLPASRSSAQAPLRAAAGTMRWWTGCVSR